MRKFQDAYREALGSVPRTRISAEALLSTPPPGRRSRPAGGWVRAAAAAVILIVCCAGTATAVNYQKSRILVEEQGYSVRGTVEDGAYAGDGYEALSGFSSAEELTESGLIALPRAEWLGEDELEAQVAVSEDSNMVMVMLFGTDDRSVSVRQWDTRGSQAFASSTVYMGESVNERSFTGGQGFCYTVFDTLGGENGDDKTDGEVLSTHAVISVNGRELQYDFRGYEESVIESVLDRLDLSIYFAQ